MKVAVVLMSVIMLASCSAYAGSRAGASAGTWTVFVKEKNGQWLPEVLDTLAPESKAECEMVARNFRKWSPGRITKTVCVKLPSSLAEKYKQIREEIDGNALYQGEPVGLKALPEEVQRYLR